jgi:sugar phosphate isomerase/epimerase
VNRRTFLQTALGAAAAPALSLAAARVPLGLNTYCLRAMRWRDQLLLDYCATQKLDACFLQDSLDPDTQKPEHWPKVKAWAAERGLHLETGTGPSLPKSPELFDASVKNLRDGIRRARAMGSPVVRTLCAADREHLPPGPIEQHSETVIKIFRAVRSEAMDAGLKIAVENHKDLQAWEMRQLIEGAGKEFVGSYLDTGNPVFVLEDPLTTVEVLGPLAVTVHLRDTVIYEHPRGVAVQWVPLGEGTVDFPRFIARMKEVCPPVYVYIKPITGRPPQVLPWLERDFWKLYPKARASELTQFLALAKKGRPYEGHVVIEDLPGRQTPEHFLSAIQFQQRDHMERSIAYARKTLGLGVRQG